MLKPNFAVQKIILEYDTVISYEFFSMINFRIIRRRLNKSIKEEI